MKRHEVVLCKGRYDMGVVNIPEEATLVGLSTASVFRRMISWVWNTGWKPPITIIIAAANSSDEDKARANLVCCGINDEQEIQAALDCHDGIITVPSVSIT